MYELRRTGSVVTCLLAILSQVKLLKYGYFINLLLKLYMLCYVMLCYVTLIPSVISFRSFC